MTPIQSTSSLSTSEQARSKEFLSKPRLQVELHAESGLVRISLRGTHREQLTKVLHSLAETYARRRDG